MSSDDLSQAQGDLSQTIKDLQSLYPGLITQYDIENGKLEEKLQLVKDITEEQRKQSRRDAQMAVYEGEKQLPNLQNKIETAQKNQEAAVSRYDSLYAEASVLSDIKSGYYAQEQARELYGSDSKEYQAIASENQSKLSQYNEQYGQNLINGLAAASRYESLMNQASSALEKANSEGADLENLMAQYQEIYQGKMQLAMNPEGLDAAGGLDTILAKITEIEKVQQERIDLENTLAKTEKGSEEYDETAKAIQDAKDRQDELTASIAPFQEQLSGVLAAVKEINEQFSLLGGKRLNLSDLGLDGLDSYLNPYHRGSTKDQSYWEQVAAHYEKTGQTPKGYASGTLSAPPGLAWVGENGPELVRMRGGERVYNAGESMRIAEQTAARSSGGSSIAGSISVSLGGMTINVNASGDGGEDIVAQIRARLPEIGNEMCSMIATQLAKSYANMPTNAVEGI